jgi:hypothetical protein
MSPRDGAVSITDKFGRESLRALALRPCSPEWDALCFELLIAGRVPVNRAWQDDVNRRMVEHRARLGLR